MHWVLSTVIASFLISISYLIRKKILQKHSISNLMFYIYIGLILSSIPILFLIKDKDNEGFKYFDSQTKVLALAAGAMIPFAIYSLTISLKNVKNPVYISIVFSVFQTILLFLLSIYILKSSYNKFTLIGTFIALVGVAIIVLNE
jgi:drug/metabolite transporter (DMT)-like permease|tara:strand:- start:187 stop:621 length:435 start_codon:yes stop_codon:yes gene_type:complete